MAEETPPRFGRYVVQAKIGEGSMGRVYRAYDPLAQRIVCIKTPRPEILTDDTRNDYLRRFEREARAAGGLSHPNIVTIYDVGQDYFVMELLEGATLQRILLDRGKLGLEEVLRILGPVSEALDHAHSRGVIHRDVKPGNIVVKPDGGPTIMDFGVAHFEASVLTAKGEFLGSPSYMAPEQIARSEATAATDVFSLAIVAYEVLTGRKPFQGDSITAIIYRVVNEDPPRPSQLNSELPARLDAVFARALAKDPAARFPTARAFVEALAGRRVEELPPAPPATKAPEPSAVPLGVAETHDLFPSRARRRLGWSAGLAAGVGLLAALYMGLAHRSVAKASMTVDTEPPGASVLLDGAIVGASPLALNGLAAGPHTVRVTRDGFAPAQVSLELVAGTQSAPIHFKLQPVDAILTVRSIPDGSAVLVDGAPAGKTPVESLALKPGAHAVQVEHDGFEPWTRAVEARSGQETTVEAALEASKAATRGARHPGGWVAEGDLVEMGPGVAPPRRIAGADAEYPPEAARLQQQGTVTVEMIVTEKGEVKGARVVESAGALLDNALLDAVSSWRFEPAQKNGVKVRVRYRYRQQFGGA
jgi:serine/threonine-protein kinase